MNPLIKKIKKISGLSLSLAKAQFKLRNEGTFLGIFWYFLNPLLTFLLLWFLFRDYFGAEIPNYPVYLLLGILLFNYFQKITIDSTGGIKNSAGLIKSINFPRESLILSIIYSSFISHLFEVLFLIIFLIFFNIPLYTIFFYFLVLLFLSIFSYGCALILSSVSIYFYDIDNLWSFFLRLLWLATPIFYLVEEKTTLYYLNLFNPLYYFITISRDTINGQIPELWFILMALNYSLLIFFIGLIVFNLLNKKVPELI